MQQYNLKVTSRDKTGRGAVRRLRETGRIPASIYSKGSARSISVSAVEFRDLKREIGGEAALIELSDEQGESMLTLIQQVDHHAIQNRINHIDFLEVKRGESFATQVPVHIVGDSDCVGVKIDGGMLETLLHEVDIRCRPSKLPDHVVVNVAELHTGEAIHVRDLPEIEGVEFLGNPDTVVVSCSAAKVASEEAAPAEAEAEAAAEGETSEAPAAE
ncbi:MAG: 50S ribosomal protein L25 [Coraliomargaritaceae bacterium]